ncbi:hypothetical protein FW755_00700 [Lonepinella koalarum]|uniref:hypothetical protein n=1 Tax=Lonepinella koalarum TaxID=53417 RepID=UPI0011E459F7|nr:hypothetical protein [Lonepinella koalarum]TYG33715.1 hypothetical protein FW755_00700 [Lonepinella koalarum]
MKNYKLHRIERVGLAILKKPKGISEREMVFSLNITSGRNEINELEHLLGIQFTREWHTTKDGLCQYYIYSIPERYTAKVLLDFLINKIELRTGKTITLNEQELILNQFPNIR